MGDLKLCLLLFLSTSALASAQDGDQPTCLLAKRYKTLHKYEYTYDAQSMNAINGASMLKNGPKVSCKVEIEVPQMCSFIVRTTGCKLSKVVDMDSDGNAVFSTAPTSDTFAAEMEKYPLKVVVEGVYDVKLYPEEDETTTILNFKRGIISSLLVPLLEEDKNKNMPTIHGMCRTQYSVNAREDIATDINLTRDLSRCDQFVPTRDHNSPLALISGMHYPLAQLVRSSQTCNYKFDNTNKHMTSASCTEKHILVPFSHKGEYGVTNVGMQELTLVAVSAHNDRVFDYNEANVKDLYMEAAEDKSAVQDKDAGLALMRELATLPENEGDRRANLFHKLISMVRGMKTETLTPIIPEAMQVSRTLTFQVLAQCGTPECSSAIMQILRTFDSSSLEVDATVFAMGLVSNPSALLIKDMLEMAKYKSSKPIMYALSNVVKRFYKAEGKMIPEIHSVADFMAAKLGDCTGEKDMTFMTLRVIGNMAAAMGAASPALRSAVIQCVNQPAASPAIQQAAVQVYRLTPVPEEGREVLMQVVLDSASPLQKRVAAYLVMMKDPQQSELAQIVAALPTERDQQAKSFIISHMTNIMSSTESATEDLRQKIGNVLQSNEIGSVMDPTKFSRNYRIGSMEGNMIFEGASYLPKELMLEMTLKAFGYDIDMMEIGMEGQGFEPTVEALFGENGFFPDSAMKTMFFVSDNMPLAIQEILENMMPILKDKMKKKASHGLMRELGRNLNKLVRELKTKQSPEAMVYMRLLGNELGYLRTNEMEEMAYSAAMMIDSMFKMFPTDMMKALMTRNDNSMFAHYIFMDNEFFLPTATGVPLKIALSGTFAPGIKGGLKFARDMSEVTFMPSASLEFVTRVGSHFPEFIDSGLEMHTSLFHESGLSAKISMGIDRFELTMPAPTNPTKLMSIKNTLVAVSGAEMKTIPPMVNDKVDVSECTPFFAGMKYCTALMYTDAFSHGTAPYFPFTGDSKFVVELHPTGEITEYSATIAYELLMEGQDGRQKVDSVKMTLRAEGAAPTEARAIVKYNRRKHFITTDIQIPDYDVEAGFRLGVVDGNTKGKGTHSISLDLINKNVPQLSLVGRANMKAMKEGMLQVQLLVPSIKADATVTANLKRDEALEIELESDIKVLEATSEQKLTMKYDASKFEVEVKSDVNSEVMLPYTDMIDKYGNDLLDMPVGESDMKVRQILVKSVEAINNYMEKYAADIPYLKDFRMPDMPEISLPEKLFMNAEAKAVYHFNNERFTVSIPLPLGGKSTEELNFPPALTTPHLSVPRWGVEVVSMEIPLPELFIPESLTLSVPLFGKAEVSTMMKCNLYDFEASMAVGKDVVEAPSYSAKFDVRGTSPFDILSMKFEGSGMLSNSDSIKAHLKSSLAHKFLDASITITEDATITDKFNLKSSSKIEATSPFGLNIVLDHTGMAGINTEEISADSNLQGTVKVGPIYGETTSTQTFSIFPFRPEAKIDSSLKIDSTFVQTQNTIAATFVNGELSVMSNTNAFEDLLTHTGELSFKDHKLSLKSDTKALALGMTINNKAEASAGAGEVVMRMETNGDHSENRIYSLLTASLDVNGLAVNSDATVKLLENEATHKATLMMNKDGLTTSGKNMLQSPLMLENTFNAGLDASKATLSIINMAAANDMKVDNTNTFTITLSSLDFNSKVVSTISEYASYNHDIIIDLKPYTASANVNNNLKMLSANFINDAQMKAEPYKMDITGSLKAMYEEEEIKHTYQISYADLTANVKCSTTGKVFGTHINQNTGLEVVGLAASITNDARFNSQPMRFDHNIRASIVPFDFNLDAIFNGDGEMTMYGKQSAQLYGKFLLKAQPLAFASSHEYRASLTQQLDNGFSLETSIDNKMDTVLSPQEQKTTLKMKSKMNDHAFNQDINVYNTAEGIGMEMSGTILTNILNTASTDNQEFTISGFLKYDKDTNSHIIYLPLIEDLAFFLDDIKSIVVKIAEALKDYINNEEIRAKLEALPQHMSDFVDQLNIEEKAIQLKQFLTDFTQDYMISMDDLEVFMMNLKLTVQKMLVGLTTYIQNFVGMMKEMIVSGTLSETVIQKIQEQLNAINMEYDIKGVMFAVIDTIKAMIQQINLEKLKGSSIAFLQDIDNNFEIMFKLDMFLNDLKEFINTFEMAKYVAELKSYILTINLEAHIQELMARIPTDIVSEIIDFVKELTQEFDIVGKVNAVYGKIRELIVKFEVDKKIETILQKIVELIKQFRIEETIKVVINKLKDADILRQVMEVMEHGIRNLRTTGIKDMIDQLNMYIDTAVQMLRSFDYNAFVDQANEVIARYTVYVNELIRALEIPQKLEATREFVNFVLSSVMGFMEQLREIKVTEMMDIIDQAMLKNMREFAEIVKQKITVLNVEAEITSFLQFVSKYYTKFMTIITDMFSSMFEVIQKMTAEQKIVSEIKQIIVGLVTGLKKAELNTPSFIFPFTDLVVPSMKLSMDKLQDFEIPTQMDIPEFTIFGFHTVQATTISFDDIKQRIIELIDFLINVEMPDMDAFFGDMTMNYLPAMPVITFPEITLPEISFPTIPQIPVDKLVSTLQVPEIKLPSIPTELRLPGIGKLYGEMKFLTPIYTVKTSAELKNSTEQETVPKVTASLMSEATSPSFEFLNYKLDSSASVAIPKRKRVVFAESFKFNHLVFEAEHQASVVLYGPSAQAHATTSFKLNTTPYTGHLTNTAFMAIEGGLSASLETLYSHHVSLPIIDLNTDVTLTQKAVVRQEGNTITLTADNEGKGKYNDQDGTHKSNLLFTITPSIVTLTFSGDTDYAILKMKQQMNAESAIPSYFKFNVRNEVEGPMIKNSLFVASGHASLYDLKVELKAKHDAELYGAVSGVLSNAIDVVVRPVEFVFDFQNKGNTKVNLFDTLTAKIDLQNDYSAIFKPDTQQMNTVALARLNQYKIFYNVTVDNNEKEAGIFVAMDGEANLDFLTTPISIPELDLPFVEFRTPAISDLNLYEQAGLKHILTTTEQTVDVDAKIVYQKSQTPLVNMGLIRVPAVGNMITDLSFKSAIINLNLNAGLYTEDDLVFRMGASTASVFEALKAKLDGTTSLTTKRGIKLANSLSLENRHIEGTHDSSISVSTDTYDTIVSVATVAKIDLPVLKLEANQNLIADTKTKPNVASTLKLKGDLDMPVIKAVGKAEADHSMKLEGTFDYVSMESTTKANIDGTVLEHYVVSGDLDNEANLYLNGDGLRSTSKVIADAKLTHDANNVISMDVNENLAIEASLSRVYAVLKFTGNNEANMFDFTTKGTHVAKATIDLTPTSSLTADIEIDMSQPSTLGELSIFEKTVVEMTVPKQKISANAKIVTPVYTTNMAADFDGDAPVFKVTFKSKATSAFVFLEYDIDASSTANFENEALDMTSKATLTHADLTMDVQHVINQALRRKRQVDDMTSRHTLNVDIISPTFTDVNYRYAARRDGISASISTPSTGFLGLQFQGRVPSQMSARLYYRYASAPEVDIDIVVIRLTPKDADKMNMQIAYNMEAPEDMLSGLKSRLPSIFSSLTMFADKYQITSNMEDMKNTVVNVVGEAYNTAVNYDTQMSQLSVFFRNVVVQYQKTVQVLLDAAVKLLRETQFKMPGSDEMTTLPEVLKKLTSSIAAVLEKTIQVVSENTEIYYNNLVDMISSVKLRMPVGDAITGGQILDQVKAIFKNIFDELVDFVKHMESLDMMLEKMGETLKAIVEKSQQFVDSVKSDYLDAVFVNINVAYRYIVTILRDVVAEVSAVNMERLHRAIENIMDMLIYVMNQFNTIFSGFLQQASVDARSYMKVGGGKLEIDLPFPFQQ